MRCIATLLIELDNAVKYMSDQLLEGFLPLPRALFIVYRNLICERNATISTINVYMRDGGILLIHTGIGRISISTKPVLRCPLRPFGKFIRKAEYRSNLTKPHGLSFKVVMFGKLSQCVTRAITGLSCMSCTSSDNQRFLPSDCHACATSLIVYLSDVLVMTDPSTNVANIVKQGGHRKAI